MYTQEYMDTCTTSTTHDEKRGSMDSPRLSRGPPKQRLLRADDTRFKAKIDGHHIRTFAYFPRVGLWAFVAFSSRSKTSLSPLEQCLRLRPYTRARVTENRERRIEGPRCTNEIDSRR